MEGEYKPLPRIKGHALSILGPTLRVEVRASGAVLDIPPLRKTGIGVYIARGCQV